VELEGKFRKAKNDEEKAEILNEGFGEHMDLLEELADDMEDDEDDDDEYDDVQSGYGNLNEEDTNAPSAVDSDDSSNSSGEEESSDEDEDEIYEGSEYRSRNDGDQFHESDQSEYFSRASQMQNNSTYR
jgi:hypothetical protein